MYSIWQSSGRVALRGALFLKRPFFNMCFVQKLWLCLTDIHLVTKLKVQSKTFSQRFVPPKKKLQVERLVNIHINGRNDFFVFCFFFFSYLENKDFFFQFTFLRMYVVCCKNDRAKQSVYRNISSILQVYCTIIYLLYTGFLLTALILFYDRKQRRVIGF